MDMIKTTDLVKQYGKSIAVDKLNLNVKKGSVYGLIGPNGAGKTTTISMLSNLIKPTSGIIEINGYEINKSQDKVREIIGICPQEVYSHENKTVYSSMRYFSELKGDTTEHVKSILEQVGLSKHSDKKILELSYGMKKMLSFAQSLLGSPELLILDEPLTNLDPKTKYDIRSLIYKSSKKATVLISSHHLDEIDKLCSHIGILMNGKLIAEDKLSNLKDSNKSVTFKISNINESMISSLKIKNVKEIVHEKGLLTVKSSKDITNELLKILIAKKANIKYMNKGKSVEEIFLENIEKSNGE